MNALTQFGIILLCFHNTPSLALPASRDCTEDNISPTADDYVWICHAPYITAPAPDTCAAIAIMPTHPRSPVCTPLNGPKTWPQSIIPSRTGIVCRAYHGERCQSSEWAPITSPGMLNLEPNWVKSIACWKCPCEGDCGWSAEWIVDPDPEATYTAPWRVPTDHRVANALDMYS